VALVAIAAFVAAAAVGADERVDITATDGVQLVGHLSGTSGPGVVLVRDPARTSREWAEAAEAIAKRGFRVLRVDLRGHGDSEGAADAATVDRDAEGAFRYVIGRKIRPVFLVGEGASGAAVIAVAGRVGAGGVVVLGSSEPSPALSALRIETLAGDLASAPVQNALVEALERCGGD
jgi:pimeloyl-ACP methyl ester carboxylesterase